VPFSNLMDPLSENTMNYHPRPLSRIHGRVDRQLPAMCILSVISKLEPKLRRVRKSEVNGLALQTPRQMRFCNQKGCGLATLTSDPPLLPELHMELGGLQDANEHAYETSPSEDNLYGPTRGHRRKG